MDLKYRFVASWSGGKDSCYAVMKAIEQQHIPVVLLNIMNEEGKVSRSHAIPHKVLLQQAELIDLPLETVPASWEKYESVFIETLHKLKKNYQIEAGVFGDIDLQEHRDWEEKVCNAAGLQALLPLWRQERRRLVVEMIDAGIEATIVSCNDTMGEVYLGRKISKPLIDELERMGVDPCGENGEYHTLVTYAPFFKRSLQVDFGQSLHHGSYWFKTMKLRQ